MTNISEVDDSDEVFMPLNAEQRDTVESACRERGHRNDFQLVEIYQERKNKLLDFVREFKR